ncbi:MAG: ABC transporter ATP-binding protein [Azospirillaceae bacterium]
MTEPAIAINGLTRRFGPLTAVDGLSLAVRTGEVVGFLGPNGAGKTTTLRMLTGGLAPDAGTARILGIDVHAEPLAARRRFGYLPEGAPLYPDMTPGALLAFIAALHGLRRRRRAGAVAEAARATRIESVLDRPIDTLSKGFRRRVALAAALIHGPEVLILDEPTDGLDPNQKHEVRALIRALAPRTAILLSTHALDEVEAVCSRAVVIAGGRIVADDTPAALAAAAPVDAPARDGEPRGLEAFFRAATAGRAA